MPKDSERLKPWQSGRNQLAQHEGGLYLAQRLNQGDSVEDILKDLTDLNYSSNLLATFHIHKAMRDS